MTDLEAENKRLRQWVTDLQSGYWVNCVYCGHRYGPAEDTPVSQAEVLKAHIEQCPEHPMSALKHELEKYAGWAPDQFARVLEDHRKLYGLYLEADSRRTQAERELGEERARLDWYLAHEGHYGAFCSYYIPKFPGGDDDPDQEQATSEEWRAAIDAARGNG